MKTLPIAVSALSLVIGALTVANAREPFGDLIDASSFDTEPVVHERKTAKMIAVTDWAEDVHDTYCISGDRPWWDDLLESWYTTITGERLRMDREEYGTCAFGHCEDAYRKGGRIVDSTSNSAATSVRSRMFADEDIVYWGRDHQHIDDADAVMLGLHGSRIWLDSGGRTYVGKMRIRIGDEECWTLGSEMRLGDGDMEFLHLSSCQSLSWDLWANWSQSFDGLHVLTGFHGTMYVARDQIDEYGAFAAEGFHVSIGEAWLDNFYLPEYRNSNDQCPVAYSVGLDVDEVVERLTTERYDSAKPDPRGNTAHGAMWIAGCDPSHGVALPDLFSEPPHTGDETPFAAIDEFQPLRMDPQQVRVMVDQVLPQWDHRLLQVQNREHWGEELSVDKVLGAVDYDRSSSKRDLGDEEIVRLQKNKGKLYYLNRELAWDLHDDATHELMSENSAAARVQSALEVMGVPMSEFGEPHVATQMVGADYVNGVNGRSTAVTHEMYRIVTLPRTVSTGAGEVPVYGSHVRAAVNSKLQRLKVDYPRFARKRRLKLRSGQDVIDDAVLEIMKRNPTYPMVIQPRLVYAKGTDPNRPRYYAPAVAFLVETGLTPFEVIVPVAR